MRSRLAQATAAFAAYLALAVAATWPLLPHATAFVIGKSTPPGEATPPLNIWAMATVLHQLVSDPLHLLEGTAFYPYHNSVAFSEHLFVPALLSAPWLLATGNWVLAYNVNLLLTLATAGLGMYLFARELTDDAGAAFAAGLLYAFHTWNVNELVRSQITANQFFPFVLLGLVRYFAAPRRGTAVLAGLFYALQSLSCMYWALYLPLLTGGAILFLWRRHRTPWRALVPLAAALAVGVALTGLLAIPYLESTRDVDFERAEPPSVPVNRYLDVLPQNLLYARLLGTALRNQNAAHFLGFSALALAVLGWTSRKALGETAARIAPFLGGLVVVGFALSLGPRVMVGDTVLGPGPYAFLREHVPVFRDVRYPERLSILLVLGLAPLLACGLARLRPRIGGAGVLLLAGVVYFEHLSVPQSLSALPGAAAVPSAYHALRDRPDVRVVAEVPAAPFLMERADGLPMYFSTVHGKRTVQGYTSVFPASYNFVKWRLFHFPHPESVRFLERFGVDAVVVAPGPDGPPPWAGPDPRWDVLGRFAEGHVVLRLWGAGRQAYTPPTPLDSSGLVELDRTPWQVQASAPKAARATDGDPQTAWSTEGRQQRGDFYRVALPGPARVGRLVVDLPRPHCFPMRLKVLGEVAGEDWVELPFDEEAAYDRLFATLLHAPREARLVLDLEAPQHVTAVRLRITDTDPFAMPWIAGEVRLYERR